MAALTGKPYLSFHEDSVHIGWGATYRLPTYPLAPKRWLSVGRRSNYLPTSQAYQGSGLPYNEKTRNAGKTSALLAALSTLGVVTRRGTGEKFVGCLERGRVKFGLG